VLVVLAVVVVALVQQVHIQVHLELQVKAMLAALVLMHHLIKAVGVEVLVVLEILVHPQVLE
jgi:hypothetical protein